MAGVTASDETAFSAGHMAGEMQVAARAPWQRPTVTKIEAVDAETGVNSTTDVNVTFS